MRLYDKSDELDPKYRNDWSLIWTPDVPVAIYAVLQDEIGEGVCVRLETQPIATLHERALDAIVSFITENSKLDQYLRIH